MHSAPCSPLDLFIGGCRSHPLPLAGSARRVWACRRIPLNPGMIAHNRHALGRVRPSASVRAASQPGAPLIFLHSILISVTMSHCDLPSLFPPPLLHPACSTSFCPPGDFLDPPRLVQRERATVKVKDDAKNTSVIAVGPHHSLITIKPESKGDSLPNKCGGRMESETFSAAS